MEDRHCMRNCKYNIKQIKKQCGSLLGVKLLNPSCHGARSTRAWMVWASRISPSSSMMSWGEHKESWGGDRERTEWMQGMYRQVSALCCR